MEGYQFDAKDKMILSHLDVSAREPVSSIAKRVRLSKEVVNYRIKRMEEEGLFDYYMTTIDLYKLNYTGFRIFLKTKNMDFESKKEIIHNSFKEYNDFVGTIAYSLGKWDVILTLFVKHIDVLYDMISSMKTNFSENILKIQFMLIVEKYIFPNSWLYSPYKTDAMFVLKNRSDTKKFELDSNNIEILHMLNKNARTKVSDIANKLNISSSAVIKRIRFLENNEIILGYRTKFSVPKLRHEYYRVFLYTKEYTKAEKQRFLNFCRNHDYILNYVDCIGPWNAELKVYSRDFHHFNKIFEEINKQFPDLINQYETCLVERKGVINYF